MKNVIFTLVAAGLLVTGMQAQTIFTYDFPGSPQGSGLVASQTASSPVGATMADFTRTNVTANNADDTFNSSAWNTTATIDFAEYVQFSITINTGYSASLTSLDFFEDGSNTVADEFRVAVSTDGFSTTLESFDYTVSTSGTTKNWDFSNINLAAGQTATFRWYVFGDTQADGSGTPGGTGTFRLDDVALNGSVALIPEPSSALLLVLGGVSLALLRRGRQ